jgi:hypothetical protein
MFRKRAQCWDKFVLRIHDPIFDTDRWLEAKTILKFRARPAPNFWTAVSLVPDPYFIKTSR